MPNVDVTLSAGRTPEQIRALIRGVHDVVVRTAGAHPEHVRVIVHEVPRAHWATGDVTLDEMDAGHSGGVVERTHRSQEQ